MDTMPLAEARYLKKTIRDTKWCIVRDGEGAMRLRRRKRVDGEEGKEM